MIANKTLVAYFSASGVTAEVAKKLAKVSNSDLYEIKPTVPYTNDDLDWTDKKSRSTVEMSNRAFRPPVLGILDNMDDYNIIFVGFPIWWYTAPTIINTFLESYDLRGKTIIPFATSGSSGMGKTNEDLVSSCVGAKLLDGRVLNTGISSEELKKFFEKYLI